MTDRIDEKRVADKVLERPLKTSYFVERQFPEIYQEHGRELIELVKSYYRFLEDNDAQSVYNIRRIYDYRNIDTTLDRMLIFFKNKFLNGLFLKDDAQFIVKNILDLYRRKGTREGIELFFQMFFQSEVEVYFPSEDIFKPSTSIWKAGAFLQLFSTTNFSQFLDVVNKKIFGDKSNAEAFVDNVYFINIRNAYVPILFMSSVKGDFIGFDIIYTLDPFTTYGQVYGSLRSVTIPSFAAGTGENKIGDLVEIRSNTGFGAKGRVSQVSQDLSGEIIFSIEDGNYGYTLSNTDILVSDQNAFFNNDEGLDFVINERIAQYKANTAIIGTVIGKKSDSIGIYLDFTEIEEQKLFMIKAGSDFTIGEEIVQENTFGIQVYGTVADEETDFILVELDRTKPQADSPRYFFEANRNIETTERVDDITRFVTAIEDDYFFESGIDIETLDRDVNISRSPLFVTEKNATARAEIGTIRNTETVTIITDIIENFLNVPIDSLNYSEMPPALAPMSGTIADANTEPNLTTPLNEAFVPTTFEIGEIATLSNINPGFNHLSDVFVLAKENLFQRFNLRNQILNVTVPFGVILFEGDIITQEKEIQTFEGDTITVEVRGEIVSISGNDITVKQRTFESFTTDEPIFKIGNTIAITVNLRSIDSQSLPLGMNAIITGTAESVVGKIQEIEIVDSGIGYENDSIVEIINTSKENNASVDMSGIANSRRQGITEGRWLSFDSQINQEKVLQDSFFYQDFSYELTTSVAPSTYVDEYKEIMHTSGLKLFTRFGKIDEINIEIDIDSAFLELVGIEPEINVIEISEENGFQYLIANTIIED